MKKKILSLILTLTMLASMLCIGSVTAFAVTRGDGSEGNPFLVSSEAELNEAIEAATDTNKYIRVTDDFTLTEDVSIDESVTIDFDSFTVDCGKNKLDISNTTNVVLKNGVLTGVGDSSLLDVRWSTNVKIQNMEFIKDGIRAVYIMNASVTLDNCKIQASMNSLNLSIVLEFSLFANHTVTATRVDLICGNTPYWVSNQAYKNDGMIGFPKVNYHFTLNGDTISDDTSDDTIYGPNESVIGGYSDAWKIKRDRRKTEVTYDIEPYYTVTIPKDAQLNTDFELSAKDVVLDVGKQLVVTVSGTVNESGNFTVTNGKTGELSYTLSDKNNAETIFKNNATVLAVDPDTGSTGAVTLHFSNPLESAKFSGNYSGTLTFTVSVDDIPA